jgi:hypothetical protein
MTRTDNQGRNVTDVSGLSEADTDWRRGLDFCVIGGPCHGVKIPKENGLRSICLKDTETKGLLLHLPHVFVANGSDFKLTIFAPEKMQDLDVAEFLNGLWTVERMKAFNPWTGTFPE